MHRAGARVHAVAAGCLGDLSPDLALNRARLQAGSDAGSRLRVLHPAQPGIGRLRCRGKRLVVTSSVPAASLDAADRHLQHGRGGHEHRDVEGSVLLGAEHLLALVEQDRDIERVVDDQVVDARAAAELLHGRAPLYGLGERHVSHRRRAIGDQREHGERSNDGRLGDGDLGGEVWCKRRH